MKTSPLKDNDVATLSVNKREFLLYPNKYLKLLGQYETIVVTNRGFEEYVVTRYIEKNYKYQEYKELLGLPEEYGCGCKRADKALCPKHSRY